MASARTMKFKLVGGVFVGVNTAVNPDAGEWSAHCADITRVAHELRGVLVFTLGGGPVSQQRHELHLAFRGLRPPPTAILTSSAIARGIVTALNWYNGGTDEIAAFAPGELEHALHHLERGRGPLPRDEIVRALESLASELSIELPKKLSTSLRPVAR